MISVAHDRCDRKMAEWDDIINNCLMMGRARWLTYATNAKRRRRENEEEERRPGARPLAGRGERPKLPRVVQGERLREENFQRIMQRGRNRPAFMPRPFIQVHHAHIPLPMPSYPVLGMASLGTWIPMPLSAQE